MVLPEVELYRCAIKLLPLKSWDRQFSNCTSTMRADGRRGHKPDLYSSGFDELGVVEELTTSAFQREQARQKRNNISPVRDHVLISKLFVWVIGRLINVNLCQLMMV